METINTTIGYRTINKGIIKYYGGETNNGICYKDLNAWECGEGIIYIGEYELEDINDEPININNHWTKDSWIDFVRSVIEHHNYDDIDNLSNKDKDLLAEYIAECCLYECDWQCLSTYLEDWDWEDCIDDIMDYIHDKQKNLK